MDDRRVLIVDDDHAMAESLAEILTANGYHPAAAGSGSEALDACRRHAPSVVLVDLVLPDMDGIKLLEEMKKFMPTVECILITGYATKESAIAAVNLGAYSFLQKPYDPEQLLVTIRRAVEHRQSLDEIRSSEEKYRMIFDLSPEAIILLDTKGAVADLNGRIWDWLGYPREDIAGKHLLILPILTAASKAKVAKAFAERMLGKNVPPYELEFTAKDGVKKIGLIHGVRLLDGAGKACGDLVMISNITERKKIEEQLKAKVAEMEEFNRLAVGRELRMIELKDEVNRLLAERGKPPKYDTVK